MASSDLVTVGFAHQSITVSSTAIGGTVATFAPADQPRAKSCLISVETNPVRVRYDGGNPTTTVGHLLTAGDSMRINGAGSVTNLKMIRTGADATVQVTYER